VLIATNGNGCASASANANMHGRSALGSVVIRMLTLPNWSRRLDSQLCQSRRNFAALVHNGLLGSTACSAVEIWFQDEARVGQKGAHAYVWGAVGSRPPMIRDVRHDSAYLFGAICPDRGVGAGHIAPYMLRSAYPTAVPAAWRCGRSIGTFARQSTPPSGCPSNGSPASRYSSSTL